MNERQITGTTYPLVFLMVSSTDHVTPVTGIVPTVTLSKAGGAFASPTAVVTEVANGWYKLSGSGLSTDLGTLGPLILHATGTGADPVDQVYDVINYDPFDYVVVKGLRPEKNTALAKFPFQMTLLAGGGAATGITVTAQRSIDGGAFGACANSPAEISGGSYSIDLAAADLNGNNIILMFSGTGCNNRVINIVTQTP